VPEPYDFSNAPEEERPTEKQVNAASHVVRSYLILYREPGAMVPAPILRIANVQAGSNAAKAGILRGDYLVRYDGKRIDSAEDLGAAKKAAEEAGKERVKVVLYRGSEEIEVEIPTGQLGVRLEVR
jgi:S1-C subfamily serine protease